jgi:hypothetical protein
MLGLSVDDFVRLALVGGGFEIDAQRVQVDDLVRIALAASSKGARLRIKNSQHIPINDLIRIALAGKGSTFFE